MAKFGASRPGFFYWPAAGPKPDRTRCLRQGWQLGI